MNAAIDSSGVGFVYAGGTAIGTTIGSGGLVEGHAGDTLSNTTILAGGELSGYDGGTLTGTTLDGGEVAGNLLVAGELSGGIYIGQGALSAGAGGIISGVTLDGTTIVSSGGTATGDTDLSAEYIYSGAVASAETIGYGGQLFVNSGGQISNAAIDSGGVGFVYAGGTAIGTTISGGGLVEGHAGDMLSNTTILAGGELSGYDGGTLTGTTLDGGEVAGNLLVAGVLSGGTYIGQGTLSAGSGGTISGVTLDGTTVVSSGGTATGDTDFSAEYIYSGGIASAETIGYGGQLLVSAGATAFDPTVLSAGIVYDSGNVVFDSPTAITETGTITGPGAVIVSGPGTVTLDGGADYSGGTTLAGGTLELGTTSAGNSGGITFAGSATLGIDTTTAPTSVISGFSYGDTIDFEASPASPLDVLLVSGDTVDVTTAQALYTLDIAGASNDHLQLVTAPDGTVALHIPCFGAGSLILTPDGEVAVESLLAGDLVTVRENGATAVRAVRWIGERHIELDRHPHPDRVRPVRLVAGALAAGVPSRPLLLSPDHALLMDGRLVLARQLVNGGSITIVALPRVHYVHVELDRHSVVVVQNTEVETYLDTGNRSMFANDGSAVVLHPDFQRRDVPVSCVPLQTDPALLAALWQRLADRSAGLGFAASEVPTTREAELRLECDPTPVAAREAMSGGALRVRLRHPSAHGERALLSSRHASPAEIQPWSDDRRQLGIAIAGIRIWTEGNAQPCTLSLEDAALRSGWWPTERQDEKAWRWTDGRASIALPPLTVQIEIDVWATGTYPVPLEYCAPAGRVANA